MYLVLTRRMFLALLTGAALSLPSGPAWTKDGGGDGHGGGGDDGGGGDNSGHGGDDGHDDDGGDGRDGDHSKNGEDQWSQDKALRERELGRVIPLRTALRIVEARVRGRVIDVELLARAGRPQYRVKVRRVDGVIQTVRLDARTGRFIGFLGF